MVDVVKFVFLSDLTMMQKIPFWTKKYIAHTADVLVISSATVSLAAK